MWPLDPPSVTADESYLACSRSIQDRREKPGKPARPYRRLLAAAAPDISAASQRFEKAAAEGSLLGLKAEDFRVPGFGDDEAHRVIYARGMVKNKAGRQIYDALMAAPAHERCPFCGHGIVRELDHHLPKSSYPALCVTPLNLVPACKDCNDLKGSFVPNSPESVLIHPYYDRIDDDPWLSAKVVHTAEPTLDFFVDPPDTWDQITVSRVKHHFDLFELGRTFGTQANRLVSNIQYGVEKLLRAVGSDAVREYLQEEAETRFKSQLNGWEGVTFLTLSEDDWFCEGNFIGNSGSTG
ncbi:HNH endonuclease [Kitasatospora cheerisanensis]|uniref:HNH endonuclease n=1 Tax=Kitasatospora cheerisanensis TaxID=81942 RepID=UPI0012ECEB3F|nr:hypothetical protein [Kitasatospora cheerisanensis]